MTALDFANYLIAVFEHETEEARGHAAAGLVVQMGPAELARLEALLKARKEQLTQ
jgi:hypothetical protein